jgi:hypothetical protein
MSSPCTTIRPYPRATAGMPLRWESKQGRPWTFEYRPRGTALTEIIVPPGWDGSRHQATVRGADYRWNGDVIEVEPSTASSVSVTLARD